MLESSRSAKLEMALRGRASGMKEERRGNEEEVNSWRELL